MSLFWSLAGILITESVFGLLAKGAIAVAIVRLMWIHKKVNPSCIYMLDKTIGDGMYLITWAIPFILEHLKSQQNDMPQVSEKNDTNHDTVQNDSWATVTSIKSTSTICPTTYLFPIKILNMVTFVHSVAILTFMSVKRSMCITKPLNIMTNCSVSSALVHVAALWSLAILLGSAIQSCYTFIMCQIAQPYPVLLQISFSMCTYVVPIIIIFNSYISAIVSLRKTTCSEAILRNDVQIFKRKSLAKKMLCLVAVFGFCWIGYNSVMIARFALMEDSEILKWIMFAANVIGLSNFTLNPLAIMCLNQTILESLQCWQTKAKRNTNVFISVDRLRINRIEKADINRERTLSLETVKTDLMEE